MNFKKLKSYENKGVIVKVTWKDVFGEQSKDKDELPKIPLNEQLIINESYGEIGTVNSDCIEILHETSSLDVTRTVLPICLIVDIIKLNT